MSENSKPPEQSLLEFPCDFPIKVMGLAEHKLDLLVVEIIQKHVDNLAEGSVTMRPSRNGKYCSVTAVINVHSKAQIDAVYHELTAHEHVMMAL